LPGKKGRSTVDAQRYERVVAIMAAMAAGERAAVFRLYAEFGGHLGATMRWELRRLGVEYTSPEELDGMVIDACLELFECGAAWDPDWGVLPWTWAERRLRGIASAWVGQHADEIDVEGMDRSAATPLPAQAGDEVDLDVLARLAGYHAGAALVLDALARVATARDQAIVLEFQSQKVAGDPSPARTVAGRHHVSPEVVRQVVCRVRARLARLAVTDERNAPLVESAMVA
jgi:hypothetical protein